MVGCFGLFGFSRSFFLGLLFPFLGHVPMPFNNQPGFIFLLFGFEVLAFCLWLPFFRLFPSTFTFRFLVYCWVFIFHFWIDCSIHTTIFRMRNGGLGLCLHWSLFPSWPFMALSYPFTPFLVVSLLDFQSSLSSQLLVFPFGNFFQFQHATIIRSLLLETFHSF